MFVFAADEREWWSKQWAAVEVDIRLFMFENSDGFRERGRCGTSGVAVMD